MAEPFSIAQGAIALATTGIAIAKTLKAYIDAVRKSEAKLRPVVRDIEVMSGVLTQIGTVLENGEIRGFCKPQFFATTKGALESCKENFHALETFNNGLASINGSEIKMTISARLSLYFKQQDLDTLRGNMSESKASLNLVVGTLQIITTMRTAPKHSAAVEDLKMEMHRRLHEIEDKQKETGHTSLPPGPVVPTFDNKNPFRHGPHQFNLHIGPGRSLTASEASRGTYEWAKSSNSNRSNVTESPSTAFGTRGPSLSSALGTTAYSDTPMESDPARESNDVPDGPDRLLGRLQDASRISFAMRSAALDLIDLRKLGYPYNSQGLRSKYSEAQGIFSTLWAQEITNIPIERPTSSVKISSSTYGPPPSGGTIKYTRTGRVSKATLGQRIHPCSECGKIYTRAEHLRRHQESHKPKIYPCNALGCDRSFNRDDLMIRHRELHHSDDPDLPSHFTAALDQAPTSLVRRSISDDYSSSIVEASRKAEQSPSGNQTPEYAARSRRPVIPVLLDTASTGMYPEFSLGNWQWDPSSPYSPSEYDSPINGAFHPSSAGPYFLPPPGRDKNTTYASYPASDPYPQTSRSPVSAGSSIVPPPHQWSQNASNPGHSSGVEHMEYTQNDGREEDESGERPGMVLDDLDFDETNMDATAPIQPVSMVDELLHSWTTLDV